MPHKNTWETEGLYREFTGEINGDEILEANFELHSSPEFNDIKYIINDFLGVTGYSIETAHTKAYAVTDEMISFSKGKLKIALVVNQEPLIALANGYRDQMLGKLFECEIFPAIEDARKWVLSE
ncbi:MAG: hypothetical protein DIZ80_00865 [endosymbiont of Galathealinum brachiosum]|uniref:STAS/SEC14 domain-containing protein n=1 Tax=endosymbiont of Galathealinum brachiosum TaxID=2200906 RepID=A0A370DNV5_9GAMM|nr:MAG: hypothetical protein DIZ80_00865 [endosymbiont of Galathealinum brachiosum]